MMKSSIIGEMPMYLSFCLMHLFSNMLIIWRMKWQPTPVTLDSSTLVQGESLGQRSLVGYSSWGRRVRHDRVTDTHTC